MADITHPKMDYLNLVTYDSFSSKFLNNYNFFFLFGELPGELV
jgi:hypothetical protein